MQKALRDTAQDRSGDAALQEGHLEGITPPDHRTWLAVLAFWVIVVVLVIARIGVSAPSDTASPIVRGMSVMTLPLLP